MNGQPQGDGQPQSPQGDGGTPQYVTVDQLNAAITARFKAFDKKIEELFTKGSETILTKVAETIDQRFESLKQPADKKPDAPGSIDDHPVVKGLQKQLDELRKANEQSKAEAAAERAKMRETKLRQRLTDELTSHGIDPARAKHAVGFLIDVEKRVRYSGDDDDTIVFRDADGQDLDLGTGLKGWAKSEDAKIYMAPRGTQGSGDRGVSNPRAATQGQPQPGALGNWLLSMANGSSANGVGPGVVGQ